ncbi:SMI1/KNR4 family protein [Streptomyces sp. FXJ1.4098]|nr:SMI1/KNR4 family protein [Streptomyces sp. FXJ1.4098]
MGGTWAGVRERVLALRKAPRWWAVFGADFPDHGHNFELLPVLTEEQLGAVERRLGTELPEEYRTFLLEVGAGGAGPYYGLFPMKPPAPTPRPPPATARCRSAPSSRPSSTSTCTRSPGGPTTRTTTPSPPSTPPGTPATTNCSTP